MPSRSRHIGNRYLYTSGRITLPQKQKSIPYESNLEKNTILLLIFDHAVRSLDTQQVTIKWATNSGIQQRYTPDIIFEYNDICSTTFLVEVKPSAILKNEWRNFRSRFKMASKWCKERGCFFKLVTEKYIDTPYLTNVSFLLQYDQSRFPTSNLDIIPEIELQIHEILAFQPLSIIELLQSFSSDKAAQKQVLPYVWMLIRHSKLNTDMSIPLSMKTIVWNGEPPFDYNFEQSPIRRRLRSRIITP